MNPIFESARVKTQRAVDTFQHAMKQVDAELRAIVSRHPELIDEAEDLQSMRGFNMYRDGLQPSEQPEPAIAPIANDPPADDAPPIFDPMVDWMPVVYRNRATGEFHFDTNVDGMSATGYATPEAAWEAFKAWVDPAQATTPATDRDSLLPPIDTPHKPTEAEAADIGRPSEETGQ